MPLATFAAAATAACFRRGPRRAVPFLIGSLTIVKPEGTIVALIASGAILWVWSSGGIRRLGQQIRTHSRAVAIVIGFLALRLAFLRWIRLRDTTYTLDGESLSQVVDRAAVVVPTAFGLALDPALWGLFWPAFLIAAIVLAFRGTRGERALAGAVVAAMAAYTAIFLFTNWEIVLHLRQAYTRLLSQIAPAAAIAIAFGYSLLRRMVDPDACRIAPASLKGAHVGR